MTTPDQQPYSDPTGTSWSAGDNWQYGYPPTSAYPPPAPGYPPPVQPPAVSGPGYIQPAPFSPPGYAAPGYATPGYASPGYGYPAIPGHLVGPRNGLGTASLVCGIVAVVFCWTFYGGFVLGILSICFGAVGMGRAKRGEATNRGSALAGVILGIVAILIPILLVVVGFGLLAAAVSTSTHG